MRMGGNATDACCAHFEQSLDEAICLHDRQLKNRSHRTTHRTTQERTTGRFSDHQRLNSKRGAIAHERAEVFRAGKAINRREKPRTRAARKDLLERWLRWNLSDGQEPLVHRKP